MQQNQTIRTAAIKKGVHLWEIADALGMTDATFSRKLRHEFSEKQTKKILEIIDVLAEGKEQEE